MVDCVLLALLAFIMTEVANLPFDADEVYKQGANYIALSGITYTGEWRERLDSPSLTRTPFIAGHMTSPTV